ncbi:MAG: hypothetical protein J6A75_12985 [Lachnospiraceae bacterium]|nr:hypothetical protein [Lachnospiraceae bacterium]
MIEESLSAEEAAKIIQEWCLQETATEKSEEERINDEKEELKRQQQLLEQEKEEFQRNKSFEQQKLEQEKRLFEMKWKLLEEEWRKLVIERERVERKRAFYARLADYETAANSIKYEVSASVFFRGVKNLSGLKKRYRDLLKIYHPDNLHGDHDVIQKINEEFERLKKTMPKSL